MNKIRAFQQMEFAQRLDLILSRVVLMACQNDALNLLQPALDMALVFSTQIPLFLVSMHIFKVFHSSLRECKGSKSYLYQGLMLRLQASSTHKCLIGNWISHDISDVPCIHCWSFLLKSKVLWVLRLHKGCYLCVIYRCYLWRGNLPRTIQHSSLLVEVTDLVYR